MGFIVFTAFLATCTFTIVAAIAVFVTAYSSQPKDGHLQPRFGIRAQGWAVIACIFFVPAMHRVCDPRLSEQEQINSFLTSTSVLLVIWVFLLSRRLQVRNDKNEVD